MLGFSVEREYGSPSLKEIIMLSDEEKRAKRHEYYLRNMERIKATSRRNKKNKPDLYKRLNRESMRRLRAEDPVRFKAMAAHQRAVRRAKPEIRVKERAATKAWH